MIFGRRKKERLEERKLALTTQIEQLKKELDSNERPDYKQSLQRLVNDLFSAHLTGNAHNGLPPKHQRHLQGQIWERD